MWTADVSPKIYAGDDLRSHNSHLISTSLYYSTFSIPVPAMVPLQRPPVSIFLCSFSPTWYLHHLRSSLLLKATLLFPSPERLNCQFLGVWTAVSFFWGIRRTPGWRLLGLCSFSSSRRQRALCFFTVPIGANPDWIRSAIGRESRRFCLIWGA